MFLFPLYVLLMDHRKSTNKILVCVVLLFVVCLAFALRVLFSCDYVRRFVSLCVLIVMFLFHLYVLLLLFCVVLLFVVCLAFALRVLSLCGCGWRFFSLCFAEHLQIVSLSYKITFL